tara:strand:+ start:5206 stop:5895 length:690 start_codon:yes stop_codon:yes gene_type:complete
MTSKPTKKQQRLTPTQARAARRSRKQSRGKFIRYGGAILIVAIALLLILSLILPGLPIGTGSTGDSETGVNLNPFDNTPEGSWIKIENQGRDHIFPDTEHPDYNSYPATSGWHYNLPIAPVRWGVHEKIIEDEYRLHNLEHGGIAIHYNCESTNEECQNLIVSLSEFVNQKVNEERFEIILSPYENMESKIALTAWDYIDKFETLDLDRINAFIKAHHNSRNAPEWPAR